MARRRNFSGRSRAPQRKFVWARVSGSTPFAAGSNANLNLLQAFQDEYGAQVLGSTVMRIRGLIAIEKGETGIAGVVVSARITGTPNPAVAEEGALTDPHDDWFMYEPFFPDGDSASFISPLDHRMIDVKAARKIEELGEALILVAEATSGTHTLHHHLSVGLKLQ